MLIVVVSLGVSSLSKCSPLVSSLLATIMSYWEVYRGSIVDQSTLNFKVTCFITDIMTKVCLIHYCTQAARCFVFFFSRRPGQEIESLYFSSCYQNFRSSISRQNTRHCFVIKQVLFDTLWIEKYDASLMRIRQNSSSARSCWYF